MTGLFGALNTATGGMRAQQGALQTTAHNLSNANTAGYSRQRVTMKTSFPQSMAGIGQIGTGVQISGITRVTDDYITRQLENELSSLTQHENISDVLGQLEAVFNEPSDSGVASQMGKFFSAWGDLAENPELESGKTMVVAQSETFLDTINHIANQINKLGKDTAGQIEKDVLDFNSAAEQLDKLNDQIFNATIKGEQPNDLLDSRDRLLGKLTNIADVKVDIDQYERATVSFDKDTPVVSKDGVNKLKSSKEGEITLGDSPIDMEKGSIKGFQDVMSTVKEKGENLNDFVEKFKEAVNLIATGGDEDQTDFFVTDPKTNKISVNEIFVKKPGLLVAGKDFANGVSGDGSRAKAIADLKNTSLNFDDVIELDADGVSIEAHDSGSPFFDHFNEIITDMGIIKQQADNQVDNQMDLVSLLDQRRESVSGVDMNEEVVDMIRFQSAFQANARVISTINEMLDTLINRTGV